MITSYQWEKFVRDWETQFGVADSKFVKLTELWLCKNFDLTYIRLTCEACGKATRALNRHHKANDFTFALLRRGKYARRYVQFLEEDVAYLCEDCHLEVHEHYASLDSELYFVVNSLSLGEMLQDYKIVAFMTSYRNVFNWWIKRKKLKRI